MSNYTIIRLSCKLLDESYLYRNSLGKIISALEVKSIHFPTDKPRRKWEVLSRLLSTEKYTDRVPLQKTVSTGATQVKNGGLMNRYLYTDSHEAIISDELFMAVQQEKIIRSKEPQKQVAMKLTF